MHGRAVVGMIVALAAAPARADPVLEQQVGVAIDYLGVTDARGISVMADYRRPVSAHVLVTAEAGVQGAEVRGGDGGWSLANVTIGGVYVTGRSALRVTGTVPLASDEGDAAIPSSLHGTLRIAEPERFAARTGALAIAGVRRVDRPKAFAEVELAAVALIRSSASDELQLRLALRGGVRVVHRVSLIGALTTVSGILSGGLDRLDPDDPREDFRHVLELGVRAELPHVTATLRLEVPLDHSLRSRDVYVVSLGAEL